MARFLIIFLILLPFSLACTNTPIIRNYKWKFDPEKHTRDDIEKLFVIYKGRWWNYLERGMAFMEGGYWEDAIGDFQRSISTLSRDQRSARTYGVNRIDYFANRELGIAYYKNGQYEEAKEKLKASLDSVDSSRAQFYLGEVLNEIGWAGPPTIKILSHNDGDKVNYHIIKLKVEITDTNYIDSIWINDRPMFVGLGKTTAQFEKNIKLEKKDKLENGKDELYRISVKATNSAGMEDCKTIRIKLLSRNQIKKANKNNMLKLNSLGYNKIRKPVLFAVNNDDKVLIKKIFQEIYSNKENTIKENTISGNQKFNEKKCIIYPEDVLLPEERYKIFLLPFKNEKPERTYNDNINLDDIINIETHNAFKVNELKRFTQVDYKKDELQQEFEISKLTNKYYVDIEKMKKVIDEIINKTNIESEEVDGILVGKINEIPEYWDIKKLQEFIVDSENNVHKDRIIDREQIKKVIHEKSSGNVRVLMLEIKILLYDFDKIDKPILKEIDATGITGITDEPPSKEFTQKLTERLISKISTRYTFRTGKVIEILRRKDKKPGTIFKTDLRKENKIFPKMKLLIFRFEEDCVPKDLETVGRIRTLEKDKDGKFYAKAIIIKGAAKIEVDDLVVTK